MKSIFAYSELYRLLSLATGGSSDENEKMMKKSLPVYIVNFLMNDIITTSLSETPQKFETCNSYLIKASLFWGTCCTYSSDNTGLVACRNKSLKFNQRQLN